jgi:hypothetical protein
VGAALCASVLCCAALYVLRSAAFMQLLVGWQLSTPHTVALLHAAAHLAKRHLCSLFSLASPHPLLLLSSSFLPSAALLSVRCEPLDIGYIDGMLLLPLIIEHTIGAWQQERQTAPAVAAGRSGAIARGSYGRQWATVRGRICGAWGQPFLLFQMLAALAVLVLVLPNLFSGGYATAAASSSQAASPRTALLCCT